MIYEDALEYWRAKRITNDAELAEIMNGQGVLFSYHSSRIENDAVTFHDTREIFEHDGVTSYTGDLRTLFEIRNARDAYNYVLDAFGSRTALDEVFLLELHRRLTQNTYDTRRWQLGERPGTYKHHDYVTGREEIGASSETVAEEMKELLEEIQDVENEDALTAAAYFHAKFENIHPFADGNGRTGRLAMNYFLLLHNHPPVIIHEEDRADYYKALEAWDKEQNLDFLKAFLKKQTAKTWERQLSKEHRPDTSLDDYKEKAKDDIRISDSGGGPKLR